MRCCGRRQAQGWLKSLTCLAREKCSSLMLGWPAAGDCEHGRGAAEAPGLRGAWILRPWWRQESMVPALSPHAGLLQEILSRTTLLLGCLGTLTHLGAAGDRGHGRGAAGDAGLRDIRKV